MGKASRKAKHKSKKTYEYKGFTQTTKEWPILEKMFESGELSPAAMPSFIKERYPQFRGFKAGSFRDGVRRMKNKLALNTRSK